MRALVLLSKKSMLVSQISGFFKRLFHELMSQYQTCLDSFECERIPNIVTNFQNFDIYNNICYILIVSSAPSRRIVNVKVWF